MISSDPSNALDRLLAALPVGAPVGLAVPAAPGSAAIQQPGEIVLGIGLGPAEIATELAALPEDAVLVVEPASGADPATARLVVKPEAVSWRELHAALVAPRLRVDDELADLAQTIATLTGGLVTIEDTAARVLAYSSSSDEVDELRRLSILGRSGPPAYLALLRDWGIYDRLAASEEVVEIAEHPESGVRRRLAVGIFAGRRQLGTIWVQQGHTEFGPTAGPALLGAARLTAAQLVGRRPRTSALADLLAGRTGATDSLGADATRPAVVAVLELAPDDSDPAERQQKLDQLAAVVTVHAAGLRRRSMTEQIGSRVVVLLPNLADPAAAVATLTAAATAAEAVTGTPVRVGLGAPVRTARTAETSRQQAERVLRVESRATVRSFEQLRHRLLTIAVHNCLDEHADLLDTRINRLVAEDADAAITLLRYLDTGSDVSRVATDLAVHPTTVRYRLRRIAKSLDLDLADPDARLSVQLQLRHGLAPQR